MRRSLAITCAILLMGPASVSVWALSDPTRPAEYRPPEVSSDPGLQGSEAGAEAAEVRYALQYVLVSKNRKYAVINGNRVFEGDHVGDARVLRIEPGSVTIRASGVVQDLSMGFKDIKKFQGRGFR